MGFLEFFSNIFDSSNSSSDPPPDLSSSDHIVSSDTGSSLISTTDDTWSPSANDAFGTAAGDWQCAAEASSATPSFSATTDTWPSFES